MNENTFASCTCQLTLVCYSHVGQIRAKSGEGYFFASQGPATAFYHFEGYLDVMSRCSVWDIGSSALCCGVINRKEPSVIIDYADASPVQHGVIKLWSKMYSLISEAAETLRAKEDFDIKESYLLIIDPPMQPVSQHEKLASLFFEMQVRSIGFLPSEYACLLSVGIPITPVSLVLECGHAVTSIVPVVQTIPLHSASVRLDVGASTIGAYMRTLLGDSHKDMSEKDIRRLVRTHCFAALSHESELQAASSAALQDWDRTFQLDDDNHTRVTVNQERFVAPEIVLCPRHCQIDYPSIEEAIWQAWNKIPIPPDYFPPTEVMLLLHGGCTQLPGFYARLEADLLHRLGMGTALRLLPVPPWRGSFAWASLQTTAFVWRNMTWISQRAWYEHPQDSLRLASKAWLLSLHPKALPSPSSPGKVGSSGTQFTQLCAAHARLEASHKQLLAENARLVKDLSEARLQQEQSDLALLDRQKEHWTARSRTDPGMAEATLQLHETRAELQKTQQLLEEERKQVAALEGQCHSLGRRTYDNAAVEALQQELMDVKEKKKLLSRALKKSMHESKTRSLQPSPSPAVSETSGEVVEGSLQLIQLRQQLAACKAEHEQLLGDFDAIVQQKVVIEIKLSDLEMRPDPVSLQIKPSVGEFLTAANNTSAMVLSERVIEEMRRSNLVLEKEQQHLQEMLEAVSTERDDLLRHQGDDKIRIGKLEELLASCGVDAKDRVMTKEKEKEKDREKEGKRKSMAPGSPLRSATGSSDVSSLIEPAQSEKDNSGDYAFLKADCLSKLTSTELTALTDVVGQVEMLQGAKRALESHVEQLRKQLALEEQEKKLLRSAEARSIELKTKAELELKYTTEAMYLLCKRCDEIANIEIDEVSLNNSPSAVLFAKKLVEYRELIVKYRMLVAHNPSSKGPEGL